MTHVRSMVACATSALALLGAASSADATIAADQTYYFYGTCADCTLNAAPGDPIAALTLVADYVPGAALDIADLVSFMYVGSDLVGSYTVTQDGIDSHLGNAMSGAMDDSAGPKDFRLDFGDGLRFDTTSLGAWYTCAPAPDGSPYYSGTCDYLQNSDFARTGAQWNAAATTNIPEPTPLALLVMGVVTAGAASRRRHRPT